MYSSVLMKEIVVVVVVGVRRGVWRMTIRGRKMNQSIEKVMEKEKRGREGKDRKKDGDGNIRNKYWMKES